MPFRYVKGDNDEPIMPQVSSCGLILAKACPVPTNALFQGMRELIEKDTDKAVNDLF